jgi:hypothetical protein
MNSAFAPALLDPDLPPPDGVTGPDGLAAPKRFGVYRNNVVVSLIEAMRAAYPSLLAVMGDSAFDRVARNYIDAHPPASAMMQAFGAHFADFLDGFPPVRNSPFLSDIARLERAHLDAWHAADAEPLDPAMLAAVAPEEAGSLRFEAHPAAFVIESRFPVVDLFAWRNGRPDGGADLKNAQAALVTRPHLEVIVQAVPLGTARFLACLLAGEELQEAAEAALACDPQFELAPAIALALSAGAFRAPSRPLQS